MNMLVEGKVAGIYGAGGSIGSVAARAFARAGARVSRFSPGNMQLCGASVDFEGSRSTYI